MELIIPNNKKEKLRNLEKVDRERIRKKLREIDKKITDLGVDPGKVIEKRLKGRLHPLLQQRVGKWRLWFMERKEEDKIYLWGIKEKEEAEKMY